MEVILHTRSDPNIMSAASALENRKLEAYQEPKNKTKGIFVLSH